MPINVIVKTTHGCRHHLRRAGWWLCDLADGAAVAGLPALLWLVALS